MNAHVLSDIPIKSDYKFGRTTKRLKIPFIQQQQKMVWR